MCGARDRSSSRFTAFPGSDKTRESRHKALYEPMSAFRPDLGLIALIYGLPGYRALQAIACHVPPRRVKPPLTAQSKDRPTASIGLIDTVFAVIYISASRVAEIIPKNW